MVKDYKNMELDPKYVPTKSEEYMSVKQKAYFHNMLMSQREDMLSEMADLLNEIYAAEKSQLSETGDDIDKSNLEQEAAAKRKSHTRGKNVLELIDAALQRLENGTYGYSVISGEEIGLKRLLARPLATMTTEEREEYENKRM